MVVNISFATIFYIMNPLNLPERDGNDWQNQSKKMQHHQQKGRNKGIKTLIDTLYKHKISITIS